MLFAGRIIPLKGVGDLIDATAIVSGDQDVELILAGSLNDTDFVSQMREKVSRHGMNDRVSFCGLLDEREFRQEVVRWTKAFHAFDVDVGCG